MIDKAEVTMGLYCGISPDNEAKLKKMESELAKLGKRIVWSLNTFDGSRVIQLLTFGNEKPLFVLQESKLSQISESELKSKIQAVL